jgi:SNF2 family DNA or RNA helicase
MMKLKQVCNHPAQFLHDGSRVDGRSGKLARLEELVDEIVSNHEKVLVFTQFSEIGEMLQAHIRSKRGVNVLYLHGGTSKAQRDNMVGQFQASPDFPVFILSLKAGGVGLNLTAANNVIHFDRWWNPAVENQASDRAYRIGQSKNVQVHKFICSGTLEERIDEMIDTKKELADKIIGTGENWITELTTARIKELVALKRDAIMEA